MKISIIIATWNAAKTLNRCLDSIVPQLTDETELILVDGGSKDDTNKIIDSYGDKVAVHISEPDKGIYDAWNKGVKASHGKWITFIGADDWMCEGAIDSYFNFFNNNGEDFDLVFSKLHFVDSCGRNIRNVGEPWNWNRFAHRRLKFAHPGALHNRKCFDKIGCFNIQYRICADSDFLQRLGPNVNTGFNDVFIINMSAGGVSDSKAALYEGYLSRKNNKVLSPMMNLLEYKRMKLAVMLGKIKRKLL